MVDPADLYTLNAQAAVGPGEPVLLVALDGYVDAGNGVRIAVQHLLAAETAESLQHAVVVRFDADLLTDYRSRRPALTYTDGAFTNYDGLQLVIRRLTDTSGTPYLLLTGPEPDLLWERFTAAVIDLVHRLNIRLVVGLMAIPMAIPHTRPAGMSQHSGRPGLIATSDAFMGILQVPGHVVGLIEYRLGELELNAVGLAAHVPHYLSRSDYPVTAQHLLRKIGEIAGLELDHEGLNGAVGTFDSELAKELAGNAEVAEVVQALERQYDSFVAATGRGLLAESEPMPTADEIGAQIEAFLADQDPHPN